MSNMGVCGQKQTWCPKILKKYARFVIFMHDTCVASDAKSGAKHMRKKGGIVRQNKPGIFIARSGAHLCPFWTI